MKIQFLPIAPGNWRGHVTPENKRRTHLSHQRTFQAVLVGLSKELEIHKATDIQLSTFHKDTDLRQDGFPKAGTRPSAPGVELYFQSELIGGAALVFATDTYREWTDNLRDIVMTLEALRSLGTRGCVGDRRKANLYHMFTIPPRAAKQRDQWSQKEQTQQTSGTRQGTTGARWGTSWLNAAATVLKAGGFPVTETAKLRVLTEANYRSVVIREALRKGHPDHGGNNDAYIAVLAARDVLKGLK